MTITADKNGKGMLKLDVDPALPEEDVYLWVDLNDSDSDVLRSPKVLAVYP